MRHTQLRSFHAVAQRLSFTAAARELGVSQPTITTQVPLIRDSTDALQLLLEMPK